MDHKIHVKFTWFALAHLKINCDVKLNWLELRDKILKRKFFILLTLSIPLYILNEGWIQLTFTIVKSCNTFKVYNLSYFISAKEYNYYVSSLYRLNEVWPRISVLFVNFIALLYFLRTVPKIIYVTYLLKV